MMKYNIPKDDCIFGKSLFDEVIKSYRLYTLKVEVLVNENK